MKTAGKKETTIEKHQYAVGDRVEKLCAVCGEERGHVVALLNVRGHISRVSCPQCGTRSAFKSGKAVRVREYLDPKEALAASGLRQ